MGGQVDAGGPGGRWDARPRRHLDGRRSGAAVTPSWRRAYSVVGRPFDGCRRVALSISASRRSASITSRRSRSPRLPDMAIDLASCSSCSGVGSASVTSSIMTEGCDGVTHGTRGESQQR
jgi:hypothetical protein